jgi:CheY-like chemotaxis protein
MTPSILVVDDDPQLRAILVILLQDEGYQVRHAVDGLAALWEIDRDPPDLVLADIRMPRLSGTELSARLGARVVPIAIILMSANAPPPLDRAAPFLRKPFAIDALLAAVSTALASV